MEFKELKNKSLSELKGLLVTEQEKLQEMRFKVAQRQLKKVSDIKKTKRIISRILTLLNDKKEKIEESK